MTYVEYRDCIRQALARHPEGLTWRELKASLKLPYRQPCPAWTKQLERDISLDRSVRRGNALIWRLG